MNEQYTPELLTQARAAESPEALLTLAAENGVTLTTEEAQAHFDRFHQTGELADEELDNVAGGCGGQEYNAYGNPKVSPHSACDDFFVCLYCGSTEQQIHRCSGLPLENLCHRCKHFSGAGSYGYCKCFQRQKA